MYELILELDKLFSCVLAIYLSCFSHFTHFIDCQSIVLHTHYSSSRFNLIFACNHPNNMFQAEQNKSLQVNSLIAL